MNKLDKQENVCDYCKQAVKKNNFYLIYRLLVVTDEHNYYVGLLKILDEMGNWLMKRGTHLSATQVLIMRPDIVKEFLDDKFGEDEEVRFWSLGESIICSKCYSEYIKMVPEK
jgi:hypothetical protein